ncbi:sialate O-acetylesterase [Candidatus Kaiserbacteria bacterium]|nr:sialate O-acetylesterase [Candidatus Kaiserbacteria bacterium]
MAHCTDGSFYYQPNRDNSGYGSDSRTIASAVTAFILTIPKRGLVMTGKEGNAAPKRADKSGTESKPLKVFILTYSDLTEAKGKLTAGFGAPENKIGPEFTFGLIMEKQLNEPVLIIKTSWGGRSLHTDFRPPNGGALAWSEAELAEKKRQGEDIEKIKAEKATASGVDYREMIANEQNNTGGYDLYANLLGHFIRDVRKDLSAPNMPFVIGVRIEDCARVASAPCIRLRG